MTTTELSNPVFGSGDMGCQIKFEKMQQALYKKA